MNEEKDGQYTTLYFMELKEGDDIEYVQFENRSDLTDAMMLMKSGSFPPDLTYKAKELYIYERAENMLC
mgnify:FL=1